MQFDGQQTDEHILFVITPHKSKIIISLFSLGIIFILVVAILFGILSYVPIATIALKNFIVVLSFVLAGVAVWWIVKIHSQDKTYITDRRIIRFDVVTPFFTNKRALFWNEVLKVKAYAPNMLFRLMKIGILQIEPVAAEAENIIIPDVYFHEDLANYIDKIIFTFKNKPEDVTIIKSFVPKPKGKRD